MSYLHLSSAIVAEVIGTSFMKLSDGFMKPRPSLVTAVGYAGPFTFCP